MANYKEPGVYLKVSNSSRGAYTSELPMYPLIIGTGSTKLKATSLAVVRGQAGTPDVLPYTTVDSITQISDLDGGSAKWVVTTDYALTTPNKITWVAGKGPAPGETYYVNLVYLVESSQYDLRLCTGISDVIRQYGPDIQENASGTVKPICPVSLGAQLAIESGAQNVYVLQVQASGAKPTAAEYIAALEKIRTVSAIWRIVPMNVDSSISQAITAHVNTMSSPDERMERTAVYTVPYSDIVVPPTKFDTERGVLSVIGGFASSLSNKRIVVAYPDTATKFLSDGVKRELGGQYLMASFAGAEMAQPLQQSRTRMNLGKFQELGGVKMTRTQKNQLAQCGVMILEQDNVGGSIIVRHQLSTDMSSTQSREISLLHVQDYCAKAIRKTCEQFIGKYNITTETIQMLKGTIESALNEFVRNGIIVSYAVGEIYQDEENPDAIIASISILPPYACNYIDITMYVQ